VFSFKLRGAYNKMASLSAEQLLRGVICSSAGNHAQGVALAASHLVSSIDRGASRICLGCLPSRLRGALPVRSRQQRAGRCAWSAAFGWPLRAAAGGYVWPVASSLYCISSSTPGILQRHWHRPLARADAARADARYSAQGCAATVCMPVTTPDIKVAAVRRLGGRVELVGETYSETQTHAQARPRGGCDLMGVGLILVGCACRCMKEQDAHAPLGPLH